MGKIQIRQDDGTLKALSDMVPKTLEELKSSKFKSVLANAEKALKSFQFQSLTCESSGDSKTNLMFAQMAIQTDPNTQFKWRAWNGTYELGDQNSFMLTALNIQDFSNAMVSHNTSVLFWQDYMEATLLNATTLEEVEAMDVEYHG